MSAKFLQAAPVFVMQFVSDTVLEMTDGNFPAEKEICKKSLMDTPFFSYYTERNSSADEQTEERSAVKYR